LQIEGDEQQSRDPRDSAQPTNQAEFARYHQQHYGQLNPEQKAFVDEVMHAVRHFRSHNEDQYIDPSTVQTREHVFNLKGDGGTGKSFAYNVNNNIQTYLY